MKYKTFILVKLECFFKADVKQHGTVKDSIACLLKKIHSYQIPVTLVLHFAITGRSAGTLSENVIGNFRFEYKIEYLEEQDILGCRLHIIMLHTHLIL